MKTDNFNKDADDIVPQTLTDGMMIRIAKELDNTDSVFVEMEHECTVLANLLGFWDSNVKTGNELTNERLVPAVEDSRQEVVRWVLNALGECGYSLVKHTKSKGETPVEEMT